MARVARTGSGRWLTAGVLGALSVLVAGFLGWTLRGWWEGRLAAPAVAPQEPAEPPPARLDLYPTSFADLPGWEDDSPAAAIPAFRRSCDKLEALPDDRPLGGAHDGRVAGTAGEWRPTCTALRALPAVGEAGAEAAVRAFFESRFQPFAATDRGDPTGLFTGYYEPTLAGSRKRSARFRFPLYLRPPELVSVDLGRFRDDLTGRRLAGRVESGSLVPYEDRAAIDGGTLAGRGLELVWVDDPVDAFFLHIQGSGRIELEDGGQLRVGYSAQNGHPYFAIGRELIERGALDPEEVSMQSIRRWLLDNPEQAAELMHRNPSYVFFRELAGEGPVGSQGVVLTPGRSLAVDRKFLPLGIPVWLDATAPAAGMEGTDVVLRRLLIAQDSGGAITGPVRGDVFWGHGEDAADVAGRMKHPGRLWLLLPRAQVPALRSPA